MKSKKINIDLTDGKTLVLNVKMFSEDEEIDINRLTRIDMNNFAAELVTFPSIINQFGLLLAELKSKEALAKMQLDVFESTIATKLRDKHNEKTGKPLSNEKTAEGVLMDKGYQAMRKRYIKAVEQQETINSIYWSLKSKDEKLDKLSLTIQAGDVQEQLANSKLQRFNNVDMAVVTFQH